MMPNNRKVNHNDIINLRITNPCATLKYIGDTFGCSKERVRQILKANSLKTRHYIPHIHRRTCINCGAVIYSSNKLYCNIDCLKQHNMIPVVCSVCGVLFYRKKTNLLRYKSRVKNYLGENVYCSRHCFGKFMGTNHGFVAHPENAGTKHKYDYNLIINLHNKHYTPTSISRETSIPLVTVYGVIKKHKEIKDG